MEKSDINIYSKSDLYYITMIGDYIKSARLAQNKTQTNLALEAGINRTTLIQLEKGKPVNVLSLIQVLRALKKLHILNELKPIPQISPLKLAAIEQKQRQRAGKQQKNVSKPKSTW